MAWLAALGALGLGWLRLWVVGLLVVASDVRSPGCALALAEARRRSRRLLRLVARLCLSELPPSALCLALSLVVLEKLLLSLLYTLYFILYTLYFILYTCSYPILTRTLHFALSRRFSAAFFKGLNLKAFTCNISQLLLLLLLLLMLLVVMLLPLHLPW